MIDRRGGCIVILYCIILHMIWATLIWCGGHDATGGTAVSALVNIFGSDTAVITVLIVTAVGAGVALLFRDPVNVVLLVPQQSLLLMSAAGAIGAIVMGKFADGVVRPRAFIAADQIHIVLIAVAHGIALVLRGAHSK